jgi:histidine triad (HIT) family protein
MNDCIFCKFAEGKIETAKVFENKKVICFLDINPAGELSGHTLVVPKKHFESLESVDDESLKETILAIKKLVPAIKKVSGADGINVIQNNGKAAGQFVMHTHFHIIPRKFGDKIQLREERRLSKPLELVETAISIKEELNKKTKRKK